MEGVPPNGYSHTRERTEERFGVDLSVSDFMDMCRYCQEDHRERKHREWDGVGRYGELRELHSYRIPGTKRNAYLVYDRKMNKVITVLDPLVYGLSKKLAVRTKESNRTT